MNGKLPKNIAKKENKFAGIGLKLEKIMPDWLYFQPVIAQMTESMQSRTAKIFPVWPYTHGSEVAMYIRVARQGPTEIPIIFMFHVCHVCRSQASHPENRPFPPTAQTCHFE